MSEESRRKARRERRKAQREAAASAAAEEARAESVPTDADRAAAQAPLPGVGGPPSGSTVYAAKMDNSLVKQAIRGRWLVTDEHRNKAIEICVRNMGCDEGMVSNGAVRNLIAIEAQNQKDEHHQAAMEKKAGDTNVQVNVGMLYGANGAPIPSVEEIHAKLEAARKILQAHAGGSA